MKIRLIFFYRTFFNDGPHWNSTEHVDRNSVLGVDIVRGKPLLICIKRFGRRFSRKDLDGFRSPSLGGY
jgi:hypothetical protein